MKLFFPILCLLIILFSCKNELKSDSSNDKIESINYEPIFLNLSPKMGGIRFYEELNKNPSIDNGFFSISLNKKTVSFKVSKLQDRIFLEYNGKTQVSNSTNTITTPFWKRAYLNNKKTVQEFVDLFKSKYGRPIDLLPFEQNNKGVYINSESRWENATNPSNRRKEYANGIENKKLYDYGFNKYFYLIFKDSSKTIMIGYENSNSNDFGIEFEINYFHNSDFMALQNKMIKDKSDFESAKSKIEKLKKEEENLNRTNREKI